MMKSLKTVLPIIQKIARRVLGMIFIKTLSITNPAAAAFEPPPTMGAIEESRKSPTFRRYYKQEWPEANPIKKKNPYSIAPKSYNKLKALQYLLAFKKLFQYRHKKSRVYVSPHNFEKPTSSFHQLLSPFESTIFGTLDVREGALYVLKTGQKIVDFEETGFDSSNHHCTLLMEASKRDRADLVRWLLMKGAKIETTNHNSNTALIFAVAYNSYETINILLQNGAFIDHQNKDGFTPLMHIISSNDLYLQTQCTDLLLKQKPNLELRDYDGRTVLMYAAREYNEENHTVKKLLEQGADPMARDIKGRTAFWYAATTAAADYKKRRHHFAISEEEQKLLQEIEQFQEDQIKQEQYNHIACQDFIKYFVEKNKIAIHQKLKTYSHCLFCQEK